MWRVTSFGNGRLVLQVQQIEDGNISCEKKRESYTHFSDINWSSPMETYTLAVTSVLSLKRILDSAGIRYKVLR